MAKKSKITIRKLKPGEEIPMELLSDYFKKTWADDIHIRSVNHSKIRFGAFEGDRMIGFICGGTDHKYNPYHPESAKGKSAPKTFMEWYKHIDVVARYVIPSHRKKLGKPGIGIGERLRWRMLAEARARDLEGISLRKMEDISRLGLERMRKRAEGIKKRRGKKMFKFDPYGFEDGSWYADILFLSKKKKVKRAKKKAKRKPQRRK